MIGVDSGVEDGDADSRSGGGGPGAGDGGGSESADGAYGPALGAVVEGVGGSGCGGRGGADGEGVGGDEAIFDDGLDGGVGGELGSGGGSGRSRRLKDGDAEALGRAAAELILDRRLAVQARLHGLERAAQFSWGRVAREVIEAYSELLR